MRCLGCYCLAFIVYLLHFDAQHHPKTFLTNVIDFLFDQTELINLQKKYEESKVEAQNKLQSSLQTLTQELDDKWNKRLR